MPFSILIQSLLELKNKTQKNYFDHFQLEMPRKKNKENIPASSMELRCLEEGTTVRQKVPGQRGVGGLAPRKVLSTRVSNRLRRPSRYDLIRKRRWEALQQAVQQLQEEEEDDDQPTSALSNTTSEDNSSGNSSSIPTDGQTSVQAAEQSSSQVDTQHTSESSSTPCTKNVTESPP